MKTLADLFEIIGQAVSQNGPKRNTWVVDYLGNTNKLFLRHHLHGWTSSTDRDAENLEVDLNEDGIQAAYWFIKAKLLTK